MGGAPGNTGIREWEPGQRGSLATGISTRAVQKDMAQGTQLPGLHMACCVVIHLLLWTESSPRSRDVSDSFLFLLHAQQCLVYSRDSITVE